MQQWNKVVGKLSDKADPFGDAAKAAMEKSQVLQGCVALKPRTLPQKGGEAANLLTLQQLKDTAVTITIGIRRAPKQSDKEQCELDQTQQQLQERLVEFFDIFLPSCLPNYRVLSRRDGLGQNIQADRTVSYACHPQVIRLMANAWARWTFDQQQEPERIAGPIGSLYLRTADPDNVLEKDWNIIKSGTNKRFQEPRHESWEKATAEILGMHLE